LKAADWPCILFLSAMSEYRSIQSRYGVLWLHACPALDHGPDWVQRERLLVDAGATESRLNFQGRSIPFHGHLFREPDGCFRFTDKDRQKYPPELLDELESVVNRTSLLLSLI
jgi:hypothetical protein